jgi:hypothetical protein
MTIHKRLSLHKGWAHTYTVAWHQWIAEAMPPFPGKEDCSFFWGVGLEMSPPLHPQSSPREMLCGRLRMDRVRVPGRGMEEPYL